MHHNTNWQKKVEQFLGNRQKLIVLLLVGILILVMALPTEEKGESADSKEPKETVTGLEESKGSYEHKLEQRLERILEHVDGVGKAEVMLTLKASAEKVVEKDQEYTNQTIEEKDGDGGTRTTKESTQGTTTVYDGGASGVQSPYVRKELSPKIEGVIVNAEGGDDPVTIKNITEAVQALFDVDTHKIKVMKMNQGK